MTYLAMRLLGYEQAANYDLSWRGWSAVPGAPVEK